MKFKPINPILKCPMCPASWTMAMPSKTAEYTIPSHDRVQYDPSPVACAGSELKAKLTYYNEN